ncbi:hypothetical protein AK812_SmicGene36912 [Symbiodinium microadriaticum]|uniref:Uncharacterized protein n=1 Tax=Symbiodinium microadriaticum TaxID=2951 RepID=A0A1Q9CHM2_SYMMI|nr:hypothetical protein AK812_SmicGene36912 [Symbiodinium microadriaticum]
MLAPRLRGAGRLAVLLGAAAAVQWDVGCIAFLFPAAPRQHAQRTALRSVEVEAEAETDVSTFDILTVGPQTNKAKLAGAIRKQLDQIDEVTVRYAGRKGMHIALNALSKANRLRGSSLEEERD